MNVDIKRKKWYNIIMSKTNYINYQEVLKDGDGYEINSYSKTKKLFKSICGIIRGICEVIPALLYILLIIVLVLLMYISALVFGIGLVSIFLVNVVIGAIMLLSSSIAILILAPIIEFLMC